MFRNTFRSAALFAALMVATSCFAGDSAIVADPTAPGLQRPQVLPTGSGLPQVNIATPNGAGLFYNRYQQFDVGPGREHNIFGLS
jgi:filamentous hemagglutinin